ncbi:putative RNA-directed DNA polymerase, eukaryota, reverse transcriptase zinc-binding domain protein [Tanacetum coccineum]
MINRILHDGECITDPNDIKLALFKFYKDKFSYHDSSVIFPPITAGKCLCDNDRIYLDSMVTLEEIKAAFWDCGSQKPRVQMAFHSCLSRSIGIFHIWIFRVSLMISSLMIVAKILANRLAKVIDSIISHEQSAFISGRQILDGPLILSELAFLDHVMDKLGFSVKWRRWIKAGLISSRASILVNGNPTSKFSLKRGLRQGDPLSPFLFIIVMEGLNIILKDGLAANLFRGVKIGSSSLHLSHLFYADDVIILSEWNQNDMDNIIRILNVFYLASRLKININKSNLYGVGVPSDEIARMAAGTGCSSSSLPFSYLGLPIGSNMGRIENWNVLIDRFKVRLSGWKANLLSLGGRLTLIKSVLGSLGINYLSIFKAPEAVTKHLESLRASFFWGATDDKKKLAWIKWSNILASHDKGGLGGAGIDQKDPDQKGISLALLVLFSIHSSGIVTLNTISFKVGDGSLIRFWKDTWIGDMPFCSCYSRLFRLEKDKNCLVKDRFTNGTWSWDWCRPVTRGRAFVDLNNFLTDFSTLTLSDSEDKVFSSLPTDGIYSVSEVRKHIDDHLLLNSLPCTRWFKAIPRKVNIFM